MAIVDEVLAGMVAELRADLTRTGLTHHRGGLARGVAWAEAAGRGPDGAWLELRLHHRPSERRMDAGLLAYLPVARGGRTTVVGTRSASYQDVPGEIANRLAREVTDWLQAAAEGRTAPVRLPMR